MEKIISKPKHFLSIFLLSILVFISSILNAQNISEEQKAQLMPSVKQLLADYEKYSQFTTDGSSLSRDYLGMFPVLFDASVKGGIFNDITPASKGSLATPNDYITIIKASYPLGLDVKIDIDGLQILDATLKKSVYAITVKAHKKMAGMFNNVKIQRFNDDLYFTLTGTDDQGKVLNLKINGIMTKDKYLSSIVNRQGRGLFVGVTGLYSQTQIYSPMSFDNTMFNAKVGMSMYPGFDLVAMFTNGFGMGTGVRLSSYQSTFSIPSYTNTSSAKLKDLDGDTYNPVLQISKMSQVSTIKSMDIPFMLKFRGGKGVTKFYLDVGMIYSMISSSTITLDGSATKGGLYSSLGNVILTDIPEYGFGTKTYSASQYELMTEEATISAYSSIGLMFQLGRSFLLKVGGGFTFGLTDLKADPNNNNNFINLLSKEPVSNTTLRATGVEIGLLYRIPFKR